MPLKQIIFKKIIIIPSIMILFYTLIGFFLLPYLGKNILQDKLSKSLNRGVTIEKITLNPYTLIATINSVIIVNKEKEVFLSAKKIYANLSLSSLFKFSINVSEFILHDPIINIIQNADQSFNFSDLMPSDQTKSNSSEQLKKDEIIGFVLENFKIIQGKIQFIDRAKNVSHLIDDFSLSLPFLSSKTEYINKKSSMDMDFLLNTVKCDIRVESTPFADDLSTNISIKTSDIDLIHYLPYITLPETLKLKNMDFNCDLHAGYEKRKSDNLFVINGKFGISNLDLKDASLKDLIKFQKLDIEILKSEILEKKLNIAKILMTKPIINLSRDKNGKINIIESLSFEDKTQSVITPEAVKASKNEESASFNLNLADFEIQEGTLLFQDKYNKDQFQSNLFPLNLRVENLIAGERVSGNYSLNLKTESSEIVDSRGSFITMPLSAEGSLKISSLLLNKYSPYYESFVNFDLAGGNSDLNVNFKISQENDNIYAFIENHEFSIQSLSMIDRQSKEEVVNIPELKIKDSKFDSKNKKIKAGIITARKGKIFIKRQKDYSINLVNSMQPQKGVGKNLGKDLRKDLAKPQPLPSPATKDSNSSDLNSSSAWNVSLNHFDVDKFNLKFNDFTNQEPVNIELSKISIKTDNLEFSTNKKGSINIDMEWNKDGYISIKGDLIPSTLTSKLDLKLEKIDIKSLQPYFTESIKILVTDGYINTTGKLGVDFNDIENPNIKFDGNTSVTNFISLDKKNTRDFFKCNSLDISKVNVSLFPIKVNVKDIALTDFYSRIIINETGDMNIASIFKSDKKPDEKAKPEEQNIQNVENSATPQVFVENITLQGGNIKFSDFLSKPNFTASMKQIAGSVTQLSSKEDARARMHLQGLHGESSPLEIVGAINPLAQNKFIDIDISFKDIALAKFTPYSSKYLGYKIQKGKLLLDLEYQINGAKLQSENRVKFDNLTLGDPVESEHATSLPVGLAISLLKNPKGQIDLDLPVTGELDDPEFSIGAIVLKMIGNLIIKVVTSPFSILGSMFGGGEDLEFVEFEYGSKTLNDAGYKKIDQLALILEQKPSVKLEIMGFYDKLRDSESLGIIRFHELIKSIKLKEMIGSGKSAATLKDVVLEPQEMEHYIQIAYDEAQFPKPKDESGKEKILDVEEQKKLLFTNTNVNTGDMRFLAMERAQNVKAYLLSIEKVEKNRIFLLEPAEDSDTEKENATFVQFLLR